ncbi:lipase, partial [Pseudomonas poae]
MYPISAQLAAFVAKTESFTSDDSSLAGLRQNYNRMCEAFTPPRPRGLLIENARLAGVNIRSYLPT